tara:strand:+ start:1299 stop:1745 length:447 start_codon:yes stop_codon:yes gene_type:complete
MLYGIIKNLGKRKPSIRSGGSSASRYACLLPILWIGGCTSIKKAGLISGASLAAASVTSALSSGVTAPLLAGASTAFVTSVVADQMLSSPTTESGGNMPTAASCAETNFWDVVGQLIEMGGWLLILVVLIPMVLGWILPGPLERKKKR